MVSKGPDVARKTRRATKKSRHGAASKAERARPSKTPPRRRAAARAVEALEVELQLRDVGSQLLHDPDALFTFRQLSGNRQIGDQFRLVLTGASPRFFIPVLTGDVAVCELDLQRYRFARSPVFFRTPGPAVRRKSGLFREPLEWTPNFTRWDAFSAGFADLKTVLDASHDVLLQKSGASLGKLTGDAYDAMTGVDVVLAKTALLNIYYRLRTTSEPLTGTQSWFSFVERIIAIDRERVLAFVRADMETILRHIHTHIGDFRADYERTPAENHRGNVPASMRGRIASMVSIKSSHDKGNFQLTLTHLNGPDEVLLDADIDESGGLLQHLLDTLKHKFSGGTHPHDVHEILWHQHGTAVGPDLGYRLIPRA